MRLLAYIYLFDEIQKKVLDALRKPILADIVINSVLKHFGDLNNGILLTTSLCDYYNMIYANFCFFRYNYGYGGAQDSGYGQPGYSQQVFNFNKNRAITTFDIM